MTEKNGSRYDRILNFIQEMVDRDMRAIYSEKVIAEAQSPANVGRMKEPDGFCVFHGPCGDTMEIYLSINDEKIDKVSFVTDGCAPTVACGSMTTKMVEGKTIEDALEITEDDLLKALDGLPRDNVHCAKLAVITLQEAIKNYESRA